MAATEKRPARSRNRPSVTGSVTEKKGGATVSEKQIPKTPDVEMLAMMSGNGFVIVKGGVTQNMGDFNSVRVDVAIGLPCKPDMEDVVETYQELSDTCDALLQRELNRAMGTTESS